MSYVGWAYVILGEAVGWFSPYGMCIHGANFFHFPGANDTRLRSGNAGFVYCLDALLGPNKADVGIGGANSIDRLDTGMVAVVVR